MARKPRPNRFRAIWVAIGFTAAPFWSVMPLLAAHPLSAGYSVGTGPAATGIAGVSALIGLIIAAGSHLGTLMRCRFWGWWVIDLLGLIIIHGAIATMAVEYVPNCSNELQGLVVDMIAATVMLFVRAATSYLVHLRFPGTSSSISTSAGHLHAAGVLASMLLAENPYWWHQFFSELGTGQAGILSFWTFNTTLTVSGIVLTTLANFISQDLSAWAAYRHRQGKRRAFVEVLKIGMIIMGICLIGLSWVPINISDPIHTGFVQVLAVTFGLMLLTVPIWLPGAPAAIYVSSYLMLGLAVLALALWNPLGYYNLTALELAFAGIIFAWLVVLIRTLEAMISDVTAP